MKIEPVNEHYVLKFPDDCSECKYCKRERDYTGEWWCSHPDMPKKENNHPSFGRMMTWDFEVIPNFCPLRTNVKGKRYFKTRTRLKFLKDWIADLEKEKEQLNESIEDMTKEIIEIEGRDIEWT